MNKFLVLFTFVVLIGVTTGAWYIWKRASDTEKLLQPPPQNSKKTAPIALQPVMETVTFETKDGIVVVGLYWNNRDFHAPAVLLLHMMPATKESWNNFALKLADAGFRVLAIDLRGHGESTMQTINAEHQTLNYKNFTDAEHQKSLLDLEAAVEFLKSKGASKIHLVGASIGANLSLQYLAEHSDMRSAILLSPGLDYRGVKTEGFVARLHEGQAVYYAAADDDPYSAQTAKTLLQKTPDSMEKELKLFDRGGHGTNIFSSHPELMGDLVNWLKKL